MVRVAYRILCLHLIFFMISGFFVSCEDAFVRRNADFSVLFVQALKGVAILDALLILIAVFMFLVHEAFGDFK